MKVCITRNDEANMNASLLRVTTALLEKSDDICLLTRSRYGESNQIETRPFEVDSKTVMNSEISIKGKPSGGLKNIFQLLKLEWQTTKWMIKNRQNFDVLHAFDLDMGLPAYLIKKLFNKKYVYHIADFYADSRNNLPAFSKTIIRRLEMMVINQAETVIVCTEERKEQIRGSKPKNTVVVHNTPILSESIKDIISNNQSLENNRVVFTYVGSLTKRRFIMDIIEVISQEPLAELIIAGTGEVVDYVDDMSKKHENITFLGKIDYNEALSLYTKSDIMFAIYDPAVPNHKYSAPNKVYEAMMTGKPIIVAKGTGIDSIVKDNNMGIVMDYSKEAFNETLNKIVHNELDINKMGINANEAYGNYSWEEMKLRIQDIYSGLE